jgi:hypothetical protein
MRQREAEAGTGVALGIVIVAVLAIGIAALMLSGQIVQVTVPHIISQIVGPSPASRPVEGVVQAPKLSAAALATTPHATQRNAATDSADEAVAAGSDGAAIPADETADPAAPALAVGARARIANTDGMGVVLYAAPRAGARQPAGLLEGTQVTVLDRSGSEWARVRADNRQAGWVHASYLAPAS